MNQTAFSKARRSFQAAALVFAAAGVFGIGSLQAQTSSSTTTATAAPGTVAITAQQKEALQAPVGPRYDDKWELYGGLSLMNGQAGQNLPKRYNMGGGEVMGTYWLGDHLGVAADYRLEAGTTPVISPYYNRVLVYQSIISGGVQWRGPMNRYAAVDYHAFGGGTTGVFDNAVKNYPGGSPVSSCPANQQANQQGNLGLYCNHTAPYAAVGGSIDFNYRPQIAIRLQPDLIIEHFGTETREFFSISAGVVWRFGHR